MINLKKTMSSSLVLTICTLLLLWTTNSQSEPTEQCFEVIDAYSNSSQLATLCVNSSKFDIEIVPQTCDSCNNEFYGSIANAIDLDFLWVLITGAMVFFMQTGFTMLEAGSVKIGNVQNILFKNMMDACIGTISFFLFGYCLAYGDDEKSNGFLGMGNLVLQSRDYNSFFFQWAFAATAATIVSGSVAERCRLDAYFFYTLALTLWVYPIVVHWLWSNTGWLSPFNENISAINGGVIDFAGSGGWSGLCGARFDQSGRKSPTLDRQFKFGHNVPFQVLGTFILWFGWYGFNPGSTLAANGAMELASKVAVNATLAAATCGMTVYVALIERISDGLRDGIWMIPAICNGILAGLMSITGILAGLVSITGPCSVVKPWAAILIGLLGGVFYCCSSWVMENFLRIDDPLDAFSVHGVCGFWGVLSTGIFAYDKEDIAFAGYSDAVVNLSQGYRFGIQLLAAVVIAAWTLINGCAIFGVLKLKFKFKLKCCGGIIIKREGLRIPEEEEKLGLDQLEHGGKGYSMARTYSVKPSTVLSKEELNSLKNNIS
eukprot:441270_1